MTYLGAFIGRVYNPGYFRAAVEEIFESRFNLRPLDCRALLHFSVKLFDHLPEIVLADIDDAHFAPGVFFRVAGVRGVDHHGLAELTPDGAWRRLGRIRRAENVVDGERPPERQSVVAYNSGR